MMRRATGKHDSRPVRVRPMFMTGLAADAVDQMGLALERLSVLKMLFREVATHGDGIRPAAAARIAEAIKRECPRADISGQMLLGWENRWKRMGIRGLKTRPDAGDTVRIASPRQLADIEETWREKLEWTRLETDRFLLGEIGLRLREIITADQATLADVVLYGEYARQSAGMSRQEAEARLAALYDEAAEGGERLRTTT